MNRRTSLVAQCIVLASVFALLESRAQASLVIGFQFSGDGTSVTVPVTGGTYTVNVVLSTDNVAVTGLGMIQGFWASRSAVLNASTIDGDVTNVTIPAAFSGLAPSVGEINDNNADGRDDVGPVANTSTGQSSPSANHPWWSKLSSSSMVYFGAATGLIGTFTVTIPAYSPSSGDFLRYTPQIQASNIVNYDNWAEITATSSTNRNGKFNTVAGDARVLIGNAVTFAAVPEPATIVLLGFGGLGLFSFCRPKRRT